MEKRFNNEVRKSIEKTIDDMNKFFYDSKISSLLFTELLFKNYCLINKSDTFEVFYTMLCQVIFLDTYKKLSYNKKHLVISEEEELYWIYINEIEDFIDLYIKIADDPSFFSYMLESSFNYQKNSGLIKFLQMKSLTEDENNYLLNIAPIHEEDLNYYKKKVEIKELIKIYNAQIRYYNKNGDIDSEEKALNNTVNFIKQLSLIDQDNFLSLAKNLIKHESNYIDINDNLNINKLLQRLLYDDHYLRNIIINLSNKDFNNNDEVQKRK